MAADHAPDRGGRLGPGVAEPVRGGRREADGVVRDQLVGVEADVDHQPAGLHHAELLAGVAHEGALARRAAARGVGDVQELDAGEGAGRQATPVHAGLELERLVLAGALEGEEPLGLAPAGDHHRAVAVVGRKAPVGAGALRRCPGEQPVERGVQQVDDVEQLAHRRLRLAGLDLRQRAGADPEAPRHLAQRHALAPPLGDLPRGDVLIDGDKIATVAPEVDADAEVIDATGKIVIPGFVDTHRHTWEAAIRGGAPNATLDDYFVDVLDTFAPLYRPEDVYASNLAGSLECINAGITTLVDWSHINNTPEHPDAAVSALKETGIRAQYAYGSANTSLADYWYESKLVIPADDVRRVRGAYFSSDDSLLTMALATRGTGFCVDDVVRAEWGMARELGLPITVHVGMGRVAGRFGMISKLAELGLLGPDTTYIHCCYFSE